MNILKSVYTTLFRTYQLRDCSREDVPCSPQLPVYGFYHVFCANRWQPLVESQLDRLRRSGLLDHTRRLYVSCIIGTDEDLKQLQQMTEGMPVEFVRVARDAALFEYPALEALYAKAKEEDCMVYYFHTKGISFAAPSPDRKFMRFRRNVEAWRDLMEYFLMDKWNIAVNALQEGYDTYGCNRTPPPPAPYKMYSGNFWWVRSSYIRRLPQLTDDQKKDRMTAETWLYFGQPNDFSAWDCLGMLYRVYVPRSLYTSTHAPMADRLRFVVSFNITKIMKKVFHYNYVKRNNDRYQHVPKR